MLTLLASVWKSDVAKTLMKPVLIPPDPPKPCWTETITDLAGPLRDQIVERIDSLLAHGVRRLYARLVAYRENNASGFKLLREITDLKDVLSKLSEEVQAAHGMKEP